MTAPIGAEVGLYVDLYVDLVQRVHIGDVIETQTGRKYGVVDVRQQQRGKHAGRQHLRCVVLAPGEGPMITARPGRDGDGIDFEIGEVHRIRWYPRGKR